MPALPGPGEDQPGDQVRVPSGENDGDRAAHAVPDDVRAGDIRAVQGRGDRVGVLLQ